MSTLIQTRYDLQWDLALKIQFVGVFRDSYAITMGSHGQINATIMKVKISLRCLGRIASTRGCIFFWKTKMLNSVYVPFFSCFLLITVIHLQTEGGWALENEEFCWKLFYFFNVFVLEIFMENIRYMIWRPQGSCFSIHGYSNDKRQLYFCGDMSSLIIISLLFLVNVSLTLF